MKKIVTAVLVAMLALSCVFVLAACNNDPLANPEGEYLLAGGQPGWGLEGDASPLDEAVANRHMTAIALNDSRISSIKGQLKGAKYLYAIDYTFEGEAGWTNEFVMEAGKDAVAVDGNCLIKVILYKKVTEAGQTNWVPTWYSSPEAGGALKSLTPETLWCPQYAEAPSDGTSGWNSNNVLLKGVGQYTIVFAEFNDGTFGLAAIQK